jgi:diguanylate cyclase (GGDEF)-like protein
VTHTQEVLAAANALLVRSLEAERQLTQHHPDLAAAASFREQAARLVDLVRDNPAQVARAHNMQVSFEAWLGRPGSAEPLEQLRAMASEFVAVEHELLTARSERRARRVQATRVACWATIGVGVLAGLMLAWQLARRLGASLASLTRAAEALARGDGSVRAEAHGDDGLAKVAQSFNAMADALGAREREGVALTRLGAYLAGAADVGEAVRLASALIAEMVPGSSGGIYVSDESRTRISPRATWGPNGESLDPFAPTECWALRRGRLHDGLDAPAAIGCAHLGGAAPDAICIPLVAEGDALSMLHVRPGQTAVGRRHLLELLTTVAERLAVSLANLRLKDSLRSQSVRDPLTSLYNRRYLEETLPRELARAERDRSSLSVIVIDVDHFKRFNDRHGHQAGDAVLREVGRTLAAHVRASDVACRYGGEEFVVVLPGASLDQAVSKAEALRAAVAQLRVLHAGMPLDPLTASFGVSASPPLERDGTSLIRAADEALYAAKRAGRDRVVAVERSDSGVATQAS